MAKMNLKLQKVLAAKIAGVGLDRVFIDPEKSADVKEAITKADIRSLISQGVIKILSVKRPSRHRARKLHAQRKKGRRRGQGNRRGKAGARSPTKRTWINRIRSQRRLIKSLRDYEQISPKTFRDVYRKVKGGFFRSQSHVMFYLKTNNLIKEGKLK